MCDPGGDQDLALLPYHEGVKIGVLARCAGWMKRYGRHLSKADTNSATVSPENGFRYREMETAVVRCVDLDESPPLLEEVRRGTRSYIEDERE